MHSRSRRTSSRLAGCWKPDRARRAIIRGRAHCLIARIRRPSDFVAISLASRPCRRRRLRSPSPRPLSGETTRRAARMARGSVCLLRDTCCKPSRRWRVRSAHGITRLCGTLQRSMTSERRNSVLPHAGGYWSMRALPVVVHTSGSLIQASPTFRSMT